MEYGFHLAKTQDKARAGELLTPHGTVPTPVFMPVGSQATVKTLTPDDVKSLGYSMILSNTYHLYLRPGTDVIAKMGGLHRFMAWDGAILTDSGGYQVFSLEALRKVDDNGVTFRSHLDGSEHLLTPELAVHYQEVLGSDIMMVLDECPPYDKTFDEVKEATERTHRWAERCLKAKKNYTQALYAIVQGGIFPKLREQSAKYLTGLEFDGYALGGLSIGEPKVETWKTVDYTEPMLPVNKPRYLMGVGSPEDLLEGISRGIDIFDCVLPTRVARNGALFTPRGRVNIHNASFRYHEEPVDPTCDCYSCKHFSAAYIRHLFDCEELLAYRLATIHNLAFISRLMRQAREAILNDGFAAFKDNFLAHYQTTEESVRLSQKQKWLKSRSRKADKSPPLEKGD